MSFAARYDGPCAACEQPIRIGQQVVYVDDELIHDHHNHGEDPDDRTNACPNCHLIHQGDCF